MRPLLRTLCVVAAVVGVLGGSVCFAQVQGPVPREKGRIQQGPFILFGSEDGGLNLMKGSEVIIFGAGIYCQGAAGYFPFDRIPEKKVNLGNGTISFQGNIPRAGVTYDQQTSIAGNRIRISFRRTGTWQGNHWEGFFFELPFNNYRAARIRADGNIVKLPEVYSEQGETIVSGARRIECNVDNPSLNLVLECDRGMSVNDRRRWHDLKYLVEVRVPEEAGQVVDLYLTLPQAPEAAEWAVRYSRVGYPVNGEKKVVLEWPKHLLRPADDRVRLERADGTAVKEGRFGQTVALDHMQCGFAMFDFSDVRQPGDYRVVWTGGKVEFPIRQSVFEDRLWEPTLDYYLPFQMCHAQVDLGPSVAGHGHCHMDDGIRVPANFPGTDGFVSYECEGTPYKAGDPVPCAKGGWHDAGDCDLNIYAQGFAVFQMALAYEEFGINRDVATLDVNAGTLATGRPDGTPDLLQQIEWGAIWLLSMMQPDGRSYVGIVEQPSRRSTPEGWDKATDNKPGTGDERQVYVDYHAELECMQATALCAAARVLARTRPQLAQTCVAAAKKAFEYFRTHKEVYRRTAYFYENTKGRDGNVAVALAELYMTTGDAAYLQQLEAMTDQIANLDMTWPAKQQSSGSSFWYAPPSMARLALKLPDGRLKAACVNVCRRGADYLNTRSSDRPWAGHYTDFGKLGNAGEYPTRVFDAYWISKVVPERKLMDKCVIPMLWLYGLHPIGDEVFVSGLGLDGPKHMHSGHLFYVFRPEGGVVPGVLVPGYTTVRWYWPRDNVLYYFDDGNVSNTESTVSDIGNYLFAVNAMKAAGF
jgi:hypothetical protein